MKTIALALAAVALAGGVASAQELQDPYGNNPDEYTVPPEEGTQIDPSDGAYDDDDLAAPDDADGSTAEAAPFEQDLAPYGTWQDDPAYGRVWSPSEAAVGVDFEPYGTSGHWALTEYGWTWDSDYDWGWAPFHYGRWVYGSSHRWCWLPGHVWGPGWVAWRHGGSYVGWAPLAPRRWAYRDHRYLPGWRFTDRRYLGGRSYAYVPRRDVGAILHRTSIVRNPRAMHYGGGQIRYSGGPTYRGYRPSRMADVAPRALPRFGGHGGPTYGRSAPVYRSQPVYRAPQQPYRAPQPIYRAPQPSYRPIQTYRPVQTGYRGPQTFRAPSQSFHGPSPGHFQHSAPSHGGFTNGGGSHGSFGGHGGGGGVRRH